MANISLIHKEVPPGLWSAGPMTAVSRQIPAILAGCFGIALSILGFIETQAYYEKEAEIAFRTFATEQSATLGKAIDRNLSILRSLTGLFSASVRVHRVEFQTFAEHIYPLASGIRALEWVPRVPAAARAEYEQLARVDGYPEFQISERDSDGNMVPALTRDEHFPVFFVEPILGNEQALGFDLASDPIRMAALQAAIDTGQIAVTATLQLVQEADSQPGFLAFAPMYRIGAVPETLESRRSELIGLAVGVFGADDIVSAALLEGAVPAPLDIYLYDVGAEPEERFLLFRPSEFAEAHAEPLSEDQLREGLFFSAPLVIGDRQWSLLFKPTPGTLGRDGRVEPWGVLCIGLLLTLLLAQHLISSGFRAAIVEGLVKEQTAELVEANNNLRLEIVQRSNAEARLARSNAELDQFASVASHDLQEPLRKVQAFSDRLLTKYANDLDEKGRDYLLRMGEATARMQTLINDLLSLSRLTTNGRQFQRTDLNAVIQGVLADIDVSIQESGAQIVVDPMPEITADPTQMRQLFQNLISNALKYRREGIPPMVRIESEPVEAKSDARHPESGCPDRLIRVSDNGIGFKPEYAERIFGMFQRLHGRMVYDGAGIGLAICRRIAEHHGGGITAEGRPGEGATITITLSGSIAESGESLQ